MSPNLYLLTSALTFIRFVNDLSYYQYHDMEYDDKFKTFVEISYDIENGKWVPSFVTEEYQKLGISYSSKIEYSYPSSLPKVYRDIDDKYYFLAETESAWIWTFPFSIVVFSLFHCIRSKVKHRRVKSSLAKYSSFSVLAVSLLSENIQHFSFRGFTQIYGLTVRSTVDYVNLVMTYSMLFSVFVYAVASPWIFAWMNTKNVLVLIYDQYRVRVRMCICVSLYYTLRFATGFTHSYLCGHPKEQAVVLFLVQVANIAILYGIRRCVRIKTLLALKAIEHSLRIAFHLLLLVESLLVDSGMLSQQTLWDQLGEIN